MEHPLIAIAAPLFELNPVKYITSISYRRIAELKLGRRAWRIFLYQLFVLALCAVLLIVAIAYL